MNNNIMKIILLFSIATTFAFDELCINCKHFKKGIFTPSMFSKCNKFVRTDNNVKHLIDGKSQKEKSENIYCSTARMFEHLCGENGNGYEAKYL